MALSALLYFEETQLNYNVLNCDYEFFVNTKKKDGKTENYWPDTKARGGYITFTILSPVDKKTDLYDWLIKGEDKQLSGVFVFDIMVGGKNERKRVIFIGARCIDLEEKFESQTEDQMTITIKFCAKLIHFGKGADFFHKNVKEEDKQELIKKSEEIENKYNNK